MRLPQPSCPWNHGKVLSFKGKVNRTARKQRSKTDSCLRFNKLQNQDTILIITWTEYHMERNTGQEDNTGEKRNFYWFQKQSREPTRQERQTPNYMPKFIKILENYTVSAFPGAIHVENGKLQMLRPEVELKRCIYCVQLSRIWTYWDNWGVRYQSEPYRVCKLRNIYFLWAEFDDLPTIVSDIQRPQVHYFTLNKLWTVHCFALATKFKPFAIFEKSVNAKRFHLEKKNGQTI